jgi:hypothetical protein
MTAALPILWWEPHVVISGHIGCPDSAWPGDMWWSKEAVMIRFLFFCFFLLLFFFFFLNQLFTHLDIWNGNLNWGTASIRLLCGYNYETFLIDSWLIWEGLTLCGWYQHEKVILGSVRKQTEQAVRSKAVSSVPPWPLLQFLPPSSCLELPWLPFMNEWKLTSEINPFFPTLFWNM